MRSGVSVKAAGVRPQALAVAREAARRSGVSLTQWLNAAIIDGASETGAPSDAQGRAMQDLPAHDAATLDDVWPRAEPDATAARPALGPAIGSDAPAEPAAFCGTGEPAAIPSRDLDRTLAEIAAPAPQAAHAPPGAPASKQRAGLEQRLAQMTEEIAALRQPNALDAALAALKHDLRALADTVTDALPSRLLAAFQGQIEALADRLAAARDSRNLAGLDERLAEVRAARGALPSAERFAALCHEVRALASQVDRHAASRPDIEALYALQAAVGDLGRVLARTASSEALAAVRGDIRAVRAKLEASSGTAPAIDQLAQLIEALGARVAAGCAQARSEIPARIETLLRAMSERFEAVRPWRSEPSGFDMLEQRIIALAQKLDAADAGHVAAIEARMADLIAELKEAHAQALETAQSAARSITRELLATHATGGEEIDALRHDVGALSTAQADADRRAAATLESIHRTLTLMLERMAATKTEISAPGLSREDAGPMLAAPPPAVAAARWTQAQSPLAPARRAGDPAPHPLEPGAGAPRRVSAAERIAASEAALATTPGPGEFDPKAAFIAAARRAARAAASARDAPAAEADPEVARGAPSAIAGTIRRYGGALLVAAAVGVLVIGTAHVLSGRLRASDSARIDPPRPIPNAMTVPADPAEAAAAPLPEPPSDPLPSARRRSQAAPDEAAFSGPGVADVVGALAATHSEPAAAAPPPPVATAPAVPVKPVASPPASSVLPASIGGPVLRSAAASEDPAAEFEVARRYSEGRGVPQSFENAARWFERAADHGLAPAQFRLGCLYEKGQGIRKDLDAARRFYLAAADRGHAKAMHNLAVLYAEGIDGKPDYKTAAQWFRRAADHGVSDSQFNLGILYARGIGVEQNLPESYKWFSLAAQQGDQDAAKKRDEVAARLDPQALVAARLAAQTFTVDPQPEDAVRVAAPPGGWDQPLRARPKAAIPRRVGARPPAFFHG